MIIRKAEQKDLKIVQEMLDLLNADRKKLWNSKNKKFHKKKIKNSKLKKKDFAENIIFIAEDSEASIGCIMGYISKRKGYICHKLGYIDALYIKKDYRKKGIATKLLAKLKKEFKSNKCDHMITHTDAENIKAQKLYESTKMSSVTVEYWKKL